MHHAGHSKEKSPEPLQVRNLILASSRPSPIGFFVVCCRRCTDLVLLAVRRTRRLYQALIGMERASVERLPTANASPDFWCFPIYATEF